MKLSELAKKTTLNERFAAQSNVFDTPKVNNKIRTLITSTLKKSGMEVKETPKGTVFTYKRVPVAAIKDDTFYISVEYGTEKDYLRMREYGATFTMGTSELDIMPDIEVTQCLFYAVATPCVENVLANFVSMIVRGIK